MNTFEEIKKLMSGKGSAERPKRQELAWRLLKRTEFEEGAIAYDRRRA